MPSDLDQPYILNGLAIQVPEQRVPFRGRPLIVRSLRPR